MFYSKNVKTSMILGQARGAMIIAAAQAGLLIYEYAPKKVKMSVCGNGGASKQQVKYMVMKILNLNKNFMKKRVVQNTLFPYYKYKYPTCDWAFTNYNTLNFFSTTDNTIPSDSVLMYPATGSYKYRPTGSFSFEFYIKPFI